MFSRRKPMIRYFAPILAVAVSLGAVSCSPAPAAPVPTSVPAAAAKQTTAASPVSAAPSASPAAVAKATGVPSPSSQPAGGAASKPLTKVIMALPTRDFGFLPAIVSLSKGFFREEGLDVEMPVMTSNASVPALTNKQIQFAVAGSSTRAAYQGAPLKAVYYTYHENTLIAVSAKELTSYKDLKGKVAAVASPGSSEDFVTKRIIQNAGLAPGDVQLIALGFGAQRVAGLISGQVQFTVVNADLAVDLEQKGYRILGDLRELMPIPWSGFAVHEDTLRDQPGMIKAWLRGNIRGLKFIKENPEEAAAIGARELKLSSDVARKATQLILPAINESDLGGFTEEGLVLNTRQEMEALKTTGDPKELGARVHDLRLLREAQKELGVPCKGGFQC